MSEAGRGGIWSRVPVIARAIVIGIVVGMAAANVWPILLLKFGVPVAAGAEAVFLIAYVWWAAGGGPPQSFRAVRADQFRASALSGAQWAWGLVAAVCFAAAI